MKKRLASTHHGWGLVRAKLAGAVVDPSWKVWSNYDVTFVPCECPPTHTFHGVACVVIRRLADKTAQCVKCGVKWTPVAHHQ